MHQEGTLMTFQIEVKRVNRRGLLDHEQVLWKGAETAQIALAHQIRLLYTSSGFNADHRVLFIGQVIQLGSL